MHRWSRRILRLLFYPRDLGPVRGSGPDPAPLHVFSAKARGNAPREIVALIAAGRDAIDAARDWQREQSFAGLWILGSGATTEGFLLDPGGAERDPGTLPEDAWLLPLSELPTWPATRIECAALVAACEAVDSVSLRQVDEDATGARSPAATIHDPAVYEPAPGGSIRRRAGASRALAKRLGAAVEPAPPPFVRGNYVSDAPIPDRIELFDAAAVGWPKRSAAAPRVLVLAPFLARGGAEHTLIETARVLAAEGELDFAFVTLAQHRAELGDRRGDFRALSPWVYSLGDLLHPDAMYGALLALVDSLDVRLIYNANGSTLFYDFARRLRGDRPSLPIADHLYDHQVGYITWYDDRTPSFVDVCIAENRRIAEKLAAAGWPRERVPVLWPCGRPSDAFPPPGERPRVREEVRRELGVAAHELLLLTAARAHPQKRPLDWVRLGERLGDAPVRFLWVGGGDLEGEMDAAIAASPAGNLRRLPFRDDIPRLLLAADAALLVSDFEGLPVFLLEALQAGRPFLATDVGDIGDLAAASGAGLVSGPAGDLDGLAAAVRRLLEPDVRAGLAANAERRGGEYGVAGCARRYGDLFQRMLASR